MPGHASGPALPASAFALHIDRQAEAATEVDIHFSTMTMPKMHAAAWCRGDERRFPAAGQHRIDGRRIVYIDDCYANSP